MVEGIDGQAGAGARRDGTIAAGTAIQTGETAPAIIGTIVDVEEVVLVAQGGADVKRRKVRAN